MRASRRGGWRDLNVTVLRGRLPAVNIIQNFDGTNKDGLGRRYVRPLFTQISIDRCAVIYLRHSLGACHGLGNGEEMRQRRHVR